MGRRSRKSKRKLNSLFTMLLLTAVLMIVSTYAWFSANREVSITGITAKVQAAEGLQISLDAKTWGSSIAVNQAALAALGQTVVPEGQESHTINTYQWPDELQPVSTAGQIQGSDVVFSFGEVDATGAKLAGIGNAAAVTAEDENHKFPNAKFIAFDIYLKNSSSNNDGDKLQLSTGSKVTINTEEGGKELTGLENCVRAGLLLYSNTKTFTDSQDAIVQIAAGTPKFAIWEPNYKKHIGEVVTNDGRIGAADTEFNTLGLLAASQGKNITPINTVDTLTASQYNPSTGALIENTEAAYMAIPKTVTSDTGEVTTIKYLTSVDSTPEQLVLAKNSVMKARVYIWLEGQDPDCNDTASTGRAFDISINLRKPTREELAAEQGG